MISKLNNERIITTVPETDDDERDGEASATHQPLADDPQSQPTHPLVVMAIVIPSTKPFLPPSS